MIKKIANFKRDLGGFTLIEILISLVIFLTISIFLGSALVSVANLQEDVTGRNRQLSELNFALGYIHHAIANSQNPVAGSTTCISSNLNFEIMSVYGQTDNKVRFINKDSHCQEISFYQLAGQPVGRLRTRISSTDNAINFAPPIDLTTDIITAFGITLIGGTIGSPENQQPKITIDITSNIEKLDIPMTVRRTVSRIKLDN